MSGAPPEREAEHFPHVVTMARRWLLVLGAVWLVLGVALNLTEFPASPSLCLLLLGLGAIHFLVARFGSHRVALVFSVHFPSRCLRLTLRSTGRVSFGGPLTASARAGYLDREASRCPWTMPRSRPISLSFDSFTSKPLRVSAFTLLSRASPTQPTGLIHWQPVLPPLKALHGPW